MAGGKVVFSGGGSMGRTMSHLAGNASKMAASALTDAAAIVEAEMKRLAPVETGNMRDKIHTTKPAIKPNEASIRVQTGRREEMGIDPNDPYYYPAAVEFGTDTQEPRPFVRPAIDNKKNEVQAVIAEKLGSAQEREARK